MTSARKIEANRRNARASTGPRTGAGKARAAQNARRHGLNLPARYDPARSGEIVALARAIAGADAGAECLELASRIAAAQIDVERARRARLDLYPQALRERDAIMRLAAIDRYEGRALSVRARAMREYDDAPDRAHSGTAAGISAKRSQQAKVRRSLGSDGVGAAGVAVTLCRGTRGLARKPHGSGHSLPRVECPCPAADCCGRLGASTKRSQPQECRASRKARRGVG